MKEDPQRYFLLLNEINDGVDDEYILAYLNGLAESAAPIEWLCHTIRRFSQHPDRKIKRTIAWSIEKRAKEEIPGNIASLLLTYLYEEPGEDEWWWAKGDNHGDAHFSFLNSDRGSSFSALMRIYDARKSDEANSNKWDLIQFIESDSSTALHIGAIHELTYMVRLDKDRAMNAFDSLMKGHEILLESQYTREFIYWALYQNYLRLHPYISKMMRHEKAEVQEQGAQLACIAEISNTAMELAEASEVAQDLADLTTAPGAPISWKRGAAHIYAHNITEEPKEICVQKLLILLSEQDEQIQNSVGHIFYSLKTEEQFYSLRSFIEAYAKQSKVINQGFSEALLNFGMLDPIWALSLVGVVLSNENYFGLPSWSNGSEEIIRLVLRIYTDPTATDEIRKASMDLFDILMEKSPGYSNKVLSEWDRR